MTGADAQVHAHIPTVVQSRHAIAARAACRGVLQVQKLMLPARHHVLTKIATASAADPAAA